MVPFKILWFLNKIKYMINIYIYIYIYIYDEFIIL